MRVLLCSDIHGNAEALAAVLEEPADYVICAGDLVHFAPQPEECIRLIREHASIVVRGNHDHGAGFGEDCRAYGPWRALEEASRFIADAAFSAEDCLYLRTLPRVDPALIEKLKEKQIPIVPRKCKTVLKILSKCNQDVVKASLEGGERAREAQHYLTAFCAAHLPIVNRVVQSYRCLTYDYFPYELSPWDTPVWFVKPAGGFVTVWLLPYALFDTTPAYLATPLELQTKLTDILSPGEAELLDALNLKERGDYNGAVRRVTTAIEVILEASLRSELLKKYSSAEVDRRLTASSNDFPGRQRQYEKLSKRELSERLKRELEATRKLRHQIVHEGYRITYGSSGRAHRAVDTGRWIFNWYENDAVKMQTREKRHLALRALGKHVAIFASEITASGVIVKKP